MFIHTFSNDVDYESVREQNDTSFTSVWLEFIGIPASLHHLAVPSQPRPVDSLLPAQVCESSVCHSNEEVQPGIYNAEIKVYNIRFGLPLHFRYQPAIRCGDDRDITNTLETLHNPQIFARTSINSPQDFATISGYHRQAHWLYNETKLGRTGNYAPYDAVYRSFESYQRVTIASDDVRGNVVFDVSTGCVEDLETVVFGTGVVLVLSTAVVLAVICIKFGRKVFAKC